MPHWIGKWPPLAIRRNPIKPIFNCREAVQQTRAEFLRCEYEELEKAPMFSLFALTAPIALLLSHGGEENASPKADGICEAQVAQQSRDNNRGVSPLPLSSDAPGWAPLFEGVGPAIERQVRIEGRVILRVSPARGPVRQSMMAETRDTEPARLVERSFGKCIDASRIGGVAASGDRLMLFLKNRQVLSAELEKGCSPRSFNRGFYMEPSKDGNLCIKRDLVQSRSGAKCQITRLRQMVLDTEG